MDKLRENLQKHKLVAWIVVLGYIAFSGCFAFPFSNELFPFDLQKGFMITASYGMIGMCFAGLLEKSKSLIVLALSLLFTIIGLGLRYLLEYGEVSNTINFIPVNIALFVIIVPIYCTVVYWCIYKWGSN